MFFLLCMICILLGVFCLFVLFCLLFLSMYIVIYCLFVYNFTDHCYRLETHKHQNSINTTIHAFVTSHGMTKSYHILSDHIISYHIISYHIISYHIISYNITPYHISIISYHNLSYHIISYYKNRKCTCNVPLMCERVANFTLDMQGVL
jgi:hypothetical protein